MFTAIIAVCSLLSVPTVIPFTMQTFGVFLSIGALGGKKGTIAVLTYILLGLCGAPVFSGFGGGIGHLFGSTGGYIFGFLFSAVVMWITEPFCSKSKLLSIASMVLGNVVCYIVGTFWFMLVYSANTGEIGLFSALLVCVFPYIIPDALKIALAFVISNRIKLNLMSMFLMLLTQKKKLIGWVFYMLMGVFDLQVR